jgi:hypothetical protein
MKRYALIESGVVELVVEQDNIPYVDGMWIDVDGMSVGPGYTYENDQFFAPIEKNRIISKVAMITKRMKLSEFVAILNASKTDAAVEAWKYVFDASTQINLDSENIKNGLELFVSKNLLTQERANEIMYSPIQQEERP